jgi:hypothetical protein
VPVANLLLGIVLVLFGRTLYWLFVALAGFLVGFELAAVLLAEQGEAVRLMVAVIGGILGAALGFLAARAAFSIGGLFAGGYLGLVLVRAWELPGEPLVWFAVGGIVGAIVAALLMDWAIIVLSSLAGAAAILAPFELRPALAVLVFAAITAVGVFVQGRRLAPTRHAR